MDQSILVTNALTFWMAVSMKFTPKLDPTANKVSILDMVNKCSTAVVQYTMILKSQEGETRIVAKQVSSTFHQTLQKISKKILILPWTMKSKLKPLKLTNKLLMDLQVL